MKPVIESTNFGSITIDGERYEHDVVIRLSGEIKKRKKKLSKAIYGTSHKLSLEEAEHIYEEGARRLVIGSGQYGLVKLTKEAGEFFDSKGVIVDLIKTPSAINLWNDAGEGTIAMFHVTC